MIKAQRIGNTLVAFIENKMYQRSFDSTDEILDVYGRLLNADESDEEEMEDLRMIFNAEAQAKYRQAEIDFEVLVAKGEEVKDLLEFMTEIRDEGHDILEVKGNALRMKGINIDMPEFIAREFMNRELDDIPAMVNFWRLLALNKDPRCREDLYNFLEKNDMSITPSGYFVAYRNVNIMSEGNVELNDYIAKRWLKTKKWKKSPKNYVVVCLDDEYDIIKYKKIDDNADYEVIGNLQEMYENLSADSEDTTVYTDAHTGTFKIKIGELVTMDRSEADANPEQTCSRGLHLGNLNFMSRGSFGRQGLVCLCNPMDVVAVPSSYDGKLRCCAYLPIAHAEYDESNSIIPVDTATFEYDYQEYTIEQLKEMVYSSTFEQLKEQQIVPMELDKASYMAILEESRISLIEMNITINERVMEV